MRADQCTNLVTKLWHWDCYQYVSLAEWAIRFVLAIACAYAYHLILKRSRKMGACS